MQCLTLVDILYSLTPNFWKDVNKRRGKCCFQFISASPGNETGVMIVEDASKSTPSINTPNKPLHWDQFPEIKKSEDAEERHFYQVENLKHTQPWRMATDSVSYQDRKLQPSASLYSEQNGELACCVLILRFLIGWLLIHHLCGFHHYTYMNLSRPGVLMCSQGPLFLESV